MEPRTLTYRKPWGGRVVFGFVNLLAIADSVGVWSEYSSRPYPDYAALLFLILYLCGGGLVFFWLSGPDDLYLNLDQKTYRHVKGWPFFPKTRTGSISDFWGVYVGRTQSSYFVGVTWWGGKGSVILGRFGNKASAESFAETLMSNLELKQVMPPRHLRPSA